MTIPTERRVHLAALLCAVGEGSEHAFHQLHRLTHLYLHHVALRVTGSAPQAEEVLQDAYITTWMQARRFDPARASAMTWLITVVRNHALSALRRQRLERHSQSLSENPALLEDVLARDQEEDDPFRLAFYATLRGRLPAALAELEPAQRQSIALAFGRGMAHAELAQHMDAPLGTVKSWLRRGMARLAEQLAQQSRPIRC